MAISIRLSSDNDVGNHWPRFRSLAERAVSAGVKGATEGLVTEARQQIGRAFPNSRRAPTAISSRVFPERTDSLEAVGTIRPRRGFGQVLESHTAGALIRPVKGKVLVVPLPAAPRGRGGRRFATLPEAVARFGDRLVFIPSRRGGDLVGTVALRQGFVGARGRGQRRRVKGQEARVVPLYLLKRSVQLRKVLSPEGLGEKWVAQVPALIDAAVARLTAGGAR